MMIIFEGLAPRLLLLTFDLPFTRHPWPSAPCSVVCLSTLLLIPESTADRTFFEAAAAGCVHDTSHLVLPLVVGWLLVEEALDLICSRARILNVNIADDHAHLIVAAKIVIAIKFWLIVQP